jgi:hypothetical protein
MIEEFKLLDNVNVAHSTQAIARKQEEKCDEKNNFSSNSGILLQIQAFCYRFRHLIQIQALATDSGTCYRFRH